MIDHAKLRRLAEDATPGPWKRVDHTTSIGARTAVVGSGRRLTTICRQCVNGIQDRKNASFIAAANPTTIIELLDEIERLKAEKGTT